METQNLFLRKLYRKVQMDTIPRYTFPEPDRAEEYLVECYRGELRKKRVAARLDEATQEKIRIVAYWLCADLKPGLLLYGNVGSGKTTMGNAVAEMIWIYHDTGVRSTSRAVKKISAIDLLELKTRDEERFEMFKTAEMLFIDDFGTEARSVKNYGNQLTPVIDLLYYRYDRRLFTILSSNLDDAAIEESYGPRIGDRFREIFDRVSYTGPSYRR